MSLKRRISALGYWTERLHHVWWHQEFYLATLIGWGIKPCLDPSEPHGSVLNGWLYGFKANLLRQPVHNVRFL